MAKTSSTRVTGGSRSMPIPPGSSGVDGSPYPALLARLNEVLDPRAEWQTNAQAVVDTIFHALPRLNWAGLFRIEGEVIRLRGSRGGIAPSEMRLGEGFCGRTALDGEIRNIANVRPHEGKEYVRYHKRTRSELTIPLQAGKRRVGVLNLESPVLARFKDDDERGCRAIADWLMKRQQRYRNVFPSLPTRSETVGNFGREFYPEFADLNRLLKRNVPQDNVDSVTKKPAHKPRHPLPELPEGLAWPQDFDKADEFGRHPKASGGIVAYLEREWKDIIAAEKIDMPTLRENFPKAAEAIKTYTKPDPTTGEKRTLPTELIIPTYPQVNTQKLERVKAGEEVVTDFRELNRLSSVALWRAKNWPSAKPS